MTLRENPLLDKYELRDWFDWGNYNIDLSPLEWLSAITVRLTLFELVNVIPDLIASAVDADDQRNKTATAEHYASWLMTFKIFLMIGFNKKKKPEPLLDHDIAPVAPLNSFHLLKYLGKVERSLESHLIDRAELECREAFTPIDEEKHQKLLMSLASDIRSPLPLMYSESRKSLSTETLEKLAKLRASRDEIAPDLLRINLLCPDDLILDAFKKWLANTRTQANLIPAIPSVDDSDLRKWKQYRLLPYVDIWLWTQSQSLKITNADMGDLLYPDLSGFDRAERIRKVLAPLAKEVFSWSMCTALEILALYESSGFQPEEG